MSKRQKRPELKVRSHYRVVEGVKVEIDPFKTDLPDMCKLVATEVLTGQQCSFSETKKQTAV